MFVSVCLSGVGIQVRHAATVHSATLSQTTDWIDSVVRMFIADARELSECVTELLHYLSALSTIPSCFDSLLLCVGPYFTITITNITNEPLYVPRSTIIVAEIQR